MPLGERVRAVGVPERRGALIIFSELKKIFMSCQVSNQDHLCYRQVVYPLRYAPWELETNVIIYITCFRNKHSQPFCKIRKRNTTIGIPTFFFQKYVFCLCRKKLFAPLTLQTFTDKKLLLEAIFILAVALDVKTNFKSCSISFGNFLLHDLFVCWA